MTKAEEQELRKLKIRVGELEKWKTKQLGLYGALLSDVVEQKIAITYARERLIEASAELGRFE